MNTNQMSTPNDGGPAFPVADTVMPNGQVQFGTWGMSLRDYLAAHATESDIAQFIPSTVRDICKMIGIDVKDYDNVNHYVQLLCAAKYRYADAMIVARNTQEETK